MHSCVLIVEMVSTPTLQGLCPRMALATGSSTAKIQHFSVRTHGELCPENFHKEDSTVMQLITPAPAVQAELTYDFGMLPLIGSQASAGGTLRGRLLIGPGHSLSGRLVSVIASPIEAGVPVARAPVQPDLTGNRRTSRRTVRNFSGPVMWGVAP